MSQVLLFRIEDKQLGVLAENVRETVVSERQSMLPGIAAILSGLMTLRGRAIPIVNLTRLMGRSIPPYNLALILENEGNVVGLPVAEVIGYRQYDGAAPNNDIFNTIEIDYEEVELLSLPLLVNLINTRLQVV